MNDWATFKAVLFYNTKICIAGGPGDGEIEDLIAELIREVHAAAFLQGINAKPEYAMEIKLGA